MAYECPPIESLIADIEKYELSVILIYEEDEDDPRFAFSVGLYHSFKHPEIIVFGLKNDIADLPLGWRAWRESVDAEWSREAKISEEQL